MPTEVLGMKITQTSKRSKLSGMTFRGAVHLNGGKEKRMELSMQENFL